MTLTQAIRGGTKSTTDPRRPAKRICILAQPQGPLGGPDGLGGKPVAMPENARRVGWALPEAATDRGQNRPARRGRRMKPWSSADRIGMPHDAVLHPGDPAAWLRDPT